MTKIICLAAAAALTLSAGGVSAGMAPLSVSSAGFDQHPELFVSRSKATTLYDQTKDDAGVAALSDDFDSAFDASDAQAADDFKVPKGKKWTITEVDVTGVYFNGPGPADSVDVYIYKANKGSQIPSKLIKKFPHAKFKDKSGSFAITLKDAPELASGTYYISVQAAMNRSGGFGEWGWETAAGEFVFGLQAAWRVPNGVDLPCTTWWRLQSCTDTAPDLMFTLKGKES